MKKRLILLIPLIIFAFLAFQRSISTAAPIVSNDDGTWFDNYLDSAGVQSTSETEHNSATRTMELVAGQTMMTDGVNRMHLATKIESRPLKGWGYTFYEVTGRPIAASTRIAVPEGTPQKEAFVKGAPLMIPYNSRLPVVVYLPKGLEIRYRIWSAEPEFKPASKG